MDRSNGYEAIASRFIAARERSRVGAGVVREWSAMLPAGAAVLDLGCGSGVPVSEVLIEGGFEVYGVDASAAMAAAFRRRFPRARIECGAAEESDFFGRSFDGVVAWGLLFLLAGEEQLRLISRVAGVLVSGGQFLFTSPTDAVTWLDAMTGRESISLGRDQYLEALSKAGLPLLDEGHAEGENYYYRAAKV